MKSITLAEGKKLVKIARKIMETHFSGLDIEMPRLKLLDDERGIFVTLKKYPNHELRGCIGYIEGIMPLRKAIREIALSAAFHDTRFSPVRKDEVKHLVVEVSVLTPPELINIENTKYYPEEIEIGRDGLIVELYGRKGLLLPQVPVEWKWNKEQFLSHTCMKAGLAPDSWLNPETKIYKFSAEIFSEEKPCGEIVKGEL